MEPVDTTAPKLPPIPNQTSASTNAVCAAVAQLCTTLRPSSPIKPEEVSRVLMAIHLLALENQMPSLDGLTLDTAVSIHRQMVTK